MEEENVKKEKKKVSKKEKPLHTCDTEVTLEEYKKLIKYYPLFYWIRVIGAAIFALLVFLFIGKGDISTELFIIMYLVVVIIVMIYFRIKINVLIESSYYRHFDNKEIDTKFKTEFYENFLLWIREKITRKINYSEITKIIETDTNFYLKFSVGNIIIQKNKCDFDTINFIKNINVDKLEVRNNNNEIIKKTQKKELNNPSKSFEKVMFILFVLTIISPLIASSIVSLLNKNKPVFLHSTSAVVYWILLPIPILSLILGKKHVKADVKFKKNVTAGIIISFIMFIFGLFSIAPTFEVEYENVLKYQNILGFQLPEVGNATAMHSDHFFVNGSSNYTATNIYFSEEDTNVVYNQILNNDNWILATNLKSELSIYLPAVTDSQNTYVSIYNATDNTYNTVPNTSGKYKIYVLTFNQLSKYLSINEYDFEYIK